jgi:hypothetical protein
MKVRAACAGRFVAAVLAVAAAGCNGGDASDADAGCVAFDPQENASSVVPAFDNFCNWSSAPATNSEDASDGVHAPGPLTVYWNNSPPHGSSTFPVGTIIIKEPQGGNPTMRQAFAMVKRGCGYNGEGAVNWEWFSLEDNGNCTMTQLWRGAFAPVGETYSGKPAGDCNGCHGMVVDNDYVWDTALQLSNF